MTLAQRLKETVLGLALERQPDIRSPYKLYDEPPMWDLMEERDGRTMAVRPAKTQVKINFVWEEVDGVTIGWHRDGKWTDDQHMSMTWEHFAKAFVMEALTRSAFFVDHVDLELGPDERAEYDLMVMERAGNPVPVTAVIGDGSDDRYTKTWDARSFLARADMDEIAEVHASGWSGYETSPLLRIAQARGETSAQSFGRVCGHYRSDNPGFTVEGRVSCDADLALAWIRGYRPEALPAVLAEDFKKKHGVPIESDLDDLVHDYASNLGTLAVNSADTSVLGDDLDPGMDDDEIHDAASEIGSDINNEGVDAQLRFLLTQGATFEEIASCMESPEPAT